MTQAEMTRRVGSAAAAGLAGTAAIMGLQAVGQKAAPRQMPPMRQHPGRYMVRRAERLLTWRQQARVTRGMEETTAQLLGVGYGLGFGLLYGLMHRKNRNLLLEGSALGLCAWATGYLGWLPAAGIMRPITRQKPVQVAGAILSHLVFGVTTAAALRKFRR